MDDPSDEEEAESPRSASAYPLWGYSCDDKPDLNSYPFRYTGSQPRYLIEAEIIRDRVLLSEFHLWECVLAGWALPRNRQELRLESMALELWDFDEELADALLRRVPKNWNLIFNPAFLFFPVSLPAFKQLCYGRQSSGAWILRMLLALSYYNDKICIH